MQINISGHFVYLHYNKSKIIFLYFVFITRLIVDFYRWPEHRENIIGAILNLRGGG